ncbi:MAG: trypsin [Myxococcales bacterium]|nr:trypsin [Myxococcales bacterium]
MRRSILVSSSLLLLATPVVAGPIQSPILGGTPATLGQYPSVVLIEVGGGLCTGTLVTKDWVLTAAHCVSPAELGVATQAQVTASVKVHFNTVNAAMSTGTVVLAADTIPDPGFDLNNLGSHDSGLIKLKTPVTDITPVPVSFDAANAPIGVAVTMVGFGATAQGGGGSVGVEYVVAQTSVSCTTAMAGLDANLLCFNQVSGKGKCQGDSGGPSFAMIAGKMMEIGITSFGDQNCAQFGADTRTDAERAFILQHIPELQCQTDADCPMMKECFENKCIVTPFQPTGLGATCAANADCDSGQCALDGSSGKCSMGCTLGMASTCPAGFDCITAGAAGTCWPASTDGGGCCDAGGAGAPTVLACIGLVGLVLRRKRRPV